MTMSITVNRYISRQQLYWRVFRGSELIARGARAYPLDGKLMEQHLRVLFPHWVKEK